MNTPDIIIIIVLAIVVAAIIVFLVKRRKKGGCASCPYSKSCGAQGCCPSQTAPIDSTKSSDNLEPEKSNFEIEQSDPDAEPVNPETKQNKSNKRSTDSGSDM